MAAIFPDFPTQDGTEIGWLALRLHFFWTGNSWLPAPPLDLLIGAEGPIESALLPPTDLALETYAKVTGLRRVTIVN